MLDYSLFWVENEATLSCTMFSPNALLLTKFQRVLVARVCDASREV